MKDDIYQMCDDMLQELEDLDKKLGKSSIQLRTSQSK